MFAHALNFINRGFGSLFWLLGVPIGSLFHKKWVPIGSLSQSLGVPNSFGVSDMGHASMWQFRVLQYGRYRNTVLTHLEVNTDIGLGSWILVKTRPKSLE